MNKFNVGDLVHVKHVVGMANFKGKHFNTVVEHDAVVEQEGPYSYFCTGGYWVNSKNMKLIKKGHYNLITAAKRTYVEVPS